MGHGGFKVRLTTERYQLNGLSSPSAHERVVGSRVSTREHSADDLVHKEHHNRAEKYPKFSGRLTPPPRTDLSQLPPHFRSVDLPT